MAEIKVTSKVVDGLKTGFILKPEKKKQSVDDLFTNDELFRTLTAFIFNGVSNTTPMKGVRKLTRKLVSLDNSDYRGTDLEFDEAEYEKYLDTYFSKIEKAQLDELVNMLENMNYVTSSGKNRAFSLGFRKELAKENIKLLDLRNDLKVSKLLGKRYGKGLDDTDVDDSVKDKKSAEKRREKKYERRSSKLLGAFDRSEPALYPSILMKHITISGGIITIDTEEYFKEIFKKEGYGTIGTGSFQFNVGGASKSTFEGKDEESKKEKDERLDREAEEQALEDFGSDMETEEGIEQKMLTKAENYGQPVDQLVSLAILDGGKYELFVFGEKKSFNSKDRDKNMEDVWNAIQDVKMPDKKSLLDILRSQRKSVLKDTILSFITPRENKISIGTATITLKRKEWKDEEDFIVWMTKGAGSQSDKKVIKDARKLAELLMKIDNQIDAIEGSWDEYNTNVPFDRFFTYLMSKQRKEMVSWLQDLITSIKDDKYNIDNPIQQETKPVIDAEGNRVLDERGFTEQEVVREGKIQVERDGKKVDYEPVYDNHEKLMELLSTLRKQLGNSKITEGLNVGQFFLQEGKREDLILEELQKDVLDALKGKGNWQTYQDEKTGDSAEFRFTTNKYVPIIKYTSNAPKKKVIDTKLDGISSREFKRGRFGESRVRATKQQKRDRASKADKDDSDELQLIYNEYMALKELIGSV
tara:strand:+ start:1093 stop:3186 length:2094 start_codon:yes stop_codon:yes gene_type:complete